MAREMEGWSMKKEKERKSEGDKGRKRECGEEGGRERNVGIERVKVGEREECRRREREGEGERENCQLGFFIMPGSSTGGHLPRALQGPLCPPLAMVTPHVLGQRAWSAGGGEPGGELAKSAHTFA